MFNLSEYRNKPQNLADFRPWAAPVAEGIVLNKAGSFQRTAHFRSPDLESATPADLVGVTARAEAAMLFVVALIIADACIALAGHFGLWLSERPPRRWGRR
jgi:hypothetical protein